MRRSEARERGGEGRQRAMLEVAPERSLLLEARLSTTVNCPTCDAYYKLKAERFGASGAKLTCPKCETIFLVFQPADIPAIDDVTLSNIARVDFRLLGVDWQLRDASGELQPLKNLATLRWLLEHGKVADSARLAFNGGSGVRLSDVDDLPAYFMSVFERARDGELGFSAPMLAEDSLPGRAPLEEVVADITAEVVGLREPAEASSEAPTFDVVGDDVVGDDVVGAPRYGVLPPDSVPPVQPQGADPVPEVRKVYITGSQSSGLRSSSTVVPILALLFVFALALAITLPFALQGARSDEAREEAESVRVERPSVITTSAGVVESRVSAESVRTPEPAEAPAAPEALDGNEAAGTGGSLRPK